MDSTWDIFKRTLMPIAREKSIINKKNLTVGRKVDVQINNIIIQNKALLKINHRNNQDTQILPNNISRLQKRRFMPQARIDLHGYCVNDAFLILETFFLKCIINNQTNVLVITGGNNAKNSKIRSEFLRAINEKFSRIIVAYSIANAKDGREGAFYLVLNKNIYTSL